MARQSARPESPATYSSMAQRMAAPSPRERDQARGFDSRAWRISVRPARLRVPPDLALRGECVRRDEPGFCDRCTEPNDIFYGYPLSSLGRTALLCPTCQGIHEDGGRRRDAMEHAIYTGVRGLDQR